MKIRLDKLLVENKLAPTRQKAQALILAGLVEVNAQKADKSGTMFHHDCQITIKGKSCPYVSRGGLKIEHGLTFFNIIPENYICADIGASTGGFTDCLLQNGAQKIYAVDVGYGQLDWKLRKDERVVVLERTNARNLTRHEIKDNLDLAVIDASFISLKILIPPLINFFKDSIAIMALIKPQFEVGRGKVGKGGVVKDPALHDEVISSTKEFTKSLGLHCSGVTPSPILGPKGNTEFLIYLTGSVTTAQL